MEMIIVLGAIVLVILVLIAKAAVKIDPVVYAVVERIGRRTGRVLTEGLNFIWPFIEKVDPRSYELGTEELAVTVFSKDRLEITITGSIQSRVYKPLVLTFVEMKPETILNGLKNAVKSEIGKIAGTKEGDIFIRERGVLRQIINCVLKNDRMPHLHVNYPEGQSPELGGSFQRWLNNAMSKISETDCENRFGYDKAALRGKLNTGWVFPMEQGEDEVEIVTFYKKNVARIQLMLDLGSLVGEISPIERRYGKEITVFEMAGVDFSQKTKDAMEKKRQTEGQMKAVETLQNTKVSIMSGLKAEGLSSKEASDDANLLIGKATQQIVTVQGGGGIPFINIQPGGHNDPSSSEGGKGGGKNERKKQK